MPLPPVSAANNLLPTRPRAGASNAANGPVRSAGADGDRLTLSANASNLYSRSLDQGKAIASADAEADRIVQDFDPRLEALAKDPDALAKSLGAPEKSPFAITSIRFADMVNSGRETSLTFENRPGDLPPAPTMMPQLWTDPRTGETNLQLREAQMRVSSGAYDLYFTLDGNGRPKLDKLYKDGKSVQSMLTDALREKIKEDPAIWGTLAGVAVAGAVVAAHEHVAKTGSPINFDAINVKLYQTDNLEVRGKVKAELTGKSSFMKASGAEVGMSYHDERWTSTTSLAYAVRDRDRPVSGWVASTGASYQMDSKTTVFANAFYDRGRKDYGAFIGLSHVID